MFILFFDEVLISIFLMTGHIKRSVVKTSQEATPTQEFGAPMLQLYHISQYEVFLSKPTYENT